MFTQKSNFLYHKNLKNPCIKNESDLIQLNLAVESLNKNCTNQKMK